MNDTTAAPFDFTELANRIPGMVTIFNISNGRYEYVSNGIHYLLGYDPDKLINDPLFLHQKTHPEDVEKNVEIYKNSVKQLEKVSSVRHELIFTYEYRMKHAAGHWVWLHTEGRVYAHDSTGKATHILHVAINIDELKTSQAELEALNEALEERVKQRTEHLTLALDASQMGTWEWDLSSNKLTWSDQLMKLFGLDPKHDSVTYKQYSTELIHPDDQKLAEQTVRNAIKTGNDYRFEHRIIWPDGSVHWMQGRGKAILKDGKAVRLVGTSMNIDNFKQAELEQRTALKKAEESENNFKQLFELAPEAIFIAGLDGKAENANKSALKLLGYSRSEIMGKTLADLVRPSDLYRLGSTDDSLSNYQDEWVLKHKDGKLIYTEINARKLPDGRWLAFVKDITERRETQLALKQSEERFKAIFEHAAVAMSVVDLEGNWLMINKNYLDMLGYKKSELKKMSFGDITHPDDRHIDELQIPQLLSNKIKSYSAEKRYIRKDGSVMWGLLHASLIRDANEKPLYAVAAIQDITDRKIAEQALIESGSRFKELADAMPQIVWTADANGQTDYYNRRWYEFTGLEPGSKDYDLAPFLHPEDVEHCEAVWEHAVQSGKQYQAEYRLRDRRHDNSYRWFLAKAIPVLDDAGKVIKWYGTSTDIDAVKRTIKRKNELEDIAANLTEERRELLALNAAKDEFISLVSHQLRTPATGVKQYVGMLLQGFFGELSTEHHEILQRAYNSNERQLRTVNDMLLVARVDANKIKLDRQKTDLVELVNDAVNEQTGEFAARQQTVLVHAPHPVEAIIDRQYFRMVVDNLIENARKYTYENGTIKITVTQDGDIAVISVKDNGVGIHPDDHNKLFRKFARVDNPLSMAAEGTGLGLYWSRKVIDLHHGSLHLASQLNKGSTFVIRVPVDGKVHAGI